MTDLAGSLGLSHLAGGFEERRPGRVELDGWNKIKIYSTVTDLARFLGLSGSRPRAMAV